MSLLYCIPTPEQQSEFLYPMMLKVKSDEETRSYQRKKLYELSLKSLGQIPQADEPNEEQKRWINYRMTHSNTWPNIRENEVGD